MDINGVEVSLRLAKDQDFSGKVLIKESLRSFLIIGPGGRFLKKINKVKSSSFERVSEGLRKNLEAILKVLKTSKIQSVVFSDPLLGLQGLSQKDRVKIFAQEIFKYSFDNCKKKLSNIEIVFSQKKYQEIFDKFFVEYLKYMVYKMSRGPFLTVDGIITKDKGVVLVKRSNPPLGWALPGGFVDYGESVEQAVVREIKEETNLQYLKPRQYKTYSNPNRDPRFHTVSVVFFGKSKGELKADSDAAEAKIFSFQKLPKKMAFDHRSIIKDFFKSHKNTNEF